MSKVDVQETALTAASRYHPQFALKQRIAGENDKIILENLAWHFVSKFDGQETPYGYNAKFGPRLIIQICARSALSLIT